MITHIVLFKLTEPTPENLQAAKDKLMSMVGNVAELRHIEVGFDVVRSPRSYDLALVTKFDSLADLEAYQVHPYHKKVGEFIATIRQSVITVDYES